MISKNRMIFSMIGFIALLFASCGDYQTQKLPDGTLEIVKYQGKATNVVIPAEIKGAPVTAIGCKIDKKNGIIGAFMGKNLTSVVIPESVTVIGPSAFSGNQLTELVLPPSVTQIGDYAFANNQLTSIFIPDSIIKIPRNAFEKNHLTDVIIPQTVTEIGENAFENNQLIGIVIPESVSRIGPMAFAHNQLTNVTFLHGAKDSVLTQIERGTFADNLLTEIRIPGSVTKIGERSFADNILSNIHIPSGVTEIGDSAFANNQLTRVNIPNSVKKLSGFNLNLLTAITIPNSVQEIGNSAFANNGLSRVTIGSNVAKIGQYAFMNNLLTSVIFPRNLNEISENAFANISHSSDYTYPSGGNSLSNVYIPNSSAKVADRAFDQSVKVNLGQSGPPPPTYSRGPVILQATGGGWVQREATAEEAAYLAWREATETRRSTGNANLDKADRLRDQWNQQIRDNEATRRQIYEQSGAGSSYRRDYSGMDRNYNSR